MQQRIESAQAALAGDLMQCVSLFAVWPLDIQQVTYYSLRK